MTQRTRLMKRAKLSERTTPKLWASLPQRKTEASAAPAEADQAEAGDRHALAALAERLREHRGAAREDDDDDRDDGGEFAHCLADLAASSFAVVARFGSRFAARGSRLGAAGAVECHVGDLERRTGASAPLRLSTRAGWLPVTRSISRLTDGSIGRRKMPGRTPIRIGHAQSSAPAAPTRAA